MRLFFRILHWAIRIGYIITVYEVIDDEIRTSEALGFMLIAELVCSLIGLIRFSADEIIPVVTGFDGNGLTGGFEYTDNGGLRIVGVVFAGLAIALRIFMLNTISVALLDFDAWAAFSNWFNNWWSGNLS